MPRTAEHRFSCYPGLHKGYDGKVRESMTYSYESHNAIYDVVVIEGAVLVRTNMGKLSPLINDWTPHHYEIANKYKLLNVYIHA